MNELNLYEHSDKRQIKNTKVQDRIKNRNVEFAAWTLHVNSVGFRMTSILIVLIVFIVFKHVNIQCIKKVWRHCCNCSDPGTKTVFNSRPDKSVSVIPISLSDSMVFSWNKKLTCVN